MSEKRWFGTLPMASKKFEVEYWDLVKHIITDNFEEFSAVLMSDTTGEQLNAMDYENMTPLHHAIYFKREKFAMTLIKCGWDVRIPDVRGMTALHLAALKSSVIILTSLLNSGCNPNVKNLNGDTALDLAKKLDRKDIVEELEYYTF